MASKWKKRNSFQVKRLTSTGRGIVFFIFSAVFTVIPFLLFTTNLLANPLYYVNHWHLHQPIYWPYQSRAGVNRWELARESIDNQSNFPYSGHPDNDLSAIFGKDDRVAAYQYRVKDALDTIDQYPQAGFTLSYTGSLALNIKSLGDAGYLGYGSDWNSGNSTARTWLTDGGQRRLDIVVFGFTHPMFPFLPEEVAKKEIELYKAVYPDAWGGTADTKGMFPSEIGFSERMIPYLVDEGLQWVYVANSHISRTIPEWSDVTTAGTDYATEPPNKADRTYDPAPGNYHWRKANIDGRKTCNELTYSYRPHYAQYIDPETGNASKIIVVPCADYEGYVDGYQTFPVDLFDDIALYGDLSQPPLVILAHDGDNAWGGGYDSYMTNTPQKADGADAKGYTVSQTQQYLDNFLPDPNDIVHVEDGPWVNADGDFGSPTFSNWNWPWIDSSGLPDNAPTFDPTAWDDNSQYWAILTALTNRVETAENLSGAPDINKILYPQNGANDVEYAWHYLIGWLDSGHIYYGTSSDFSWLPVVCGNKAAEYADNVIGAGEITTSETVPPTIWIPQRFPYNPGELNFGCAYGYQSWIYSSDFYVYTFAYDAAGIQSVTLKYRTATGSNETPVSPDNYTYAGGAAVGDWQSVAMTSGEWQFKLFLNGTDVTDANPDVKPSYLPLRYWAKISGISNKLVDYYVEAVDKNGNIAKSPIQHCWVGSGSGASSSGSGLWTPENPTKNDTITIKSDKDGSLHWGVNNWTLPAEVYWPSGTTEWGDGQAVETPLVAASTYYYIEIGPFNNSTQTVSEVNFVFHYSDDTWSSPNQKIVISIPSEIPVCSLTSPSNGQVLKSTVSVIASASDDVGVEKVLFYIDGVCVSTDTSSLYQWEWNTVSYSEGAHSIYAVAYDSAGNSGQSAVVNVTVNNINDAPSLDLISPTSGETVSGIYDITWLASDPDGDEVFITIDISSDSGGNFLRLISSASNSGAYSFDSTGFQNGTNYVIKVVASDGIASSSSVSGVFEISNQTSGGGAVGGHTITVDGDGSDWLESDIIATDLAWDHANVMNGAWATHEPPFDYTNLYATWDDNYLYIGIQIVDVTDIADPANAGSSQSSVPRAMDLPQWIAIDTKPGGYSGVADDSYDMWHKGQQFDGSNLPDYQCYFASNFWQGPFLSSYTAAGWNPDGAWSPADGLLGKSGAGSFFSIIGNAPNYATSGNSNYDYVAAGHDRSRDSFFEIGIPLSLLGNPDPSEIKIFVGHGDGDMASGVDSVPDDSATLDTPGVTDYNSPLEWGDKDVFTSSFAVVAQATGTSASYPSLSITSPVDGDTVSGNVDILAYASDSVGISSVTFYIDGVSVFSDTVYPYEYIWDGSSLADGSQHTIKVTATNTSGYSTTKQISVTVNNSSSNSAPTVSVTYPTAGQIVSETLNIQYSASDIDGDTLSVDLKFSSDSVNWNEIVSNSLNIGYYYWDTTEVPDGIYKIKVVASDGTLSSQAVSSEFTIANSISAITADINRDGIVDGEDLMILGRAYGSSSGSSRWNADADLDGDGDVDGSDMEILKTNYGRKR